jgi:hypothetical protein
LAKELSGGIKSLVQISSADERQTGFAKLGVLRREAVKRMKVRAHRAQ